MTMIEPETIANATPEQIADMRIEIVKRELSQGALAGFESSVTDYAARLVVAALNSFDEYVVSNAYRRGFEAGELNRTLCEAEHRSLDRERDEIIADLAFNAYDQSLENAALRKRTYRNPTYGWHLDELA